MSVTIQWNERTIEQLAREIERKINAEVGPVTQALRDRPADELAVGIRNALARAGVEANDSGVREVAEMLTVQISANGELVAEEVDSGRWHITIPREVWDEILQLVFRFAITGNSEIDVVGIVSAICAWAVLAIAYSDEQTKRDSS